MTTQATGRTDQEAAAIDAVRTPEQFLAAVDRALEALNAAVRARFSKSDEAKRLAEEAERLALVVTRSPFQMRGSEVVAKGFTPRFV